MNILDKIVEKTKIRVNALNLEELIKESEKFQSSNFLFEKSLKSSKGIGIIAEIKKASPSKGLICADFHPEQIAIEYEKADVNGISVLTEPYFFMGDNKYLKDVKKTVSIPLLRKDFIIDETQIYEAKIIGAECILLICAILDDKKLKKFLKIAESLGMSALVEAHNEDEIKMALNSNAGIIGVNNRNLKTFEVDFNNTLRLRKLVPDEILFVSESGIKTREDIIKLEDNGVNAVLIGETFMKSKDKISAIKELRGGI